MTPQEADRILGELIVGYPRAELADETLVAWADAIYDTGADPKAATETAHRWPRTHERFPSLAEFLSVITPRSYLQPVEDPDDLRLNPAAGQRLARVWRTELDKVAKRVAEIGAGRGSGGHWHGGPDPCPLCGGISQTAARRDP